MKYEPVIGLEVHIQLNTKTKMFCDSLNAPDEESPNTNVCPVCLGHPGTLPVANLEAVKKVVKTGLALDCNIREYSWFERKNYFYPDLPKGYQISQYESPLCEEGLLSLANGRMVRIRRIHLEEDTGRLQHDPATGKSLIDYNRAGVPLMELVTEPDLQSAQEAKEFGEDLQQLLRYLNVSGADMEKGQLRLEANLSLRPEGTEELGTKVELKNINSFRAMERAVQFEIERISKELEEGNKIVQETRGWDDAQGRTFSQREKEESHDYRYFPEPDLPPIRLNAAEIEAIKSEIVELPRARKGRFESEFGLTAEFARILTQDKELGNFFENVVSELLSWAQDASIEDKDKLTQLAANYIVTELKKLLTLHSLSVGDLKLRAENMAELIIMIYKGTVSSSGAQVILGEMVKQGDVDPSHLLQELGLSQVSDESALIDAAGRVIAAHPKAVEDFRKGKEESLKFLVGQMMKETKGAANPQVAAEVLKRSLTE